MHFFTKIHSSQIYTIIIIYCNSSYPAFCIIHIYYNCFFKNSVFLKRFYLPLNFKVFPETKRYYTYPSDTF